MPEHWLRECDLTVDDLVCLDIMMPKVDGVKVLQTIRNPKNENAIAVEQRSKVILITALGETEYIKATFKIGCEAYAAKPVDTEKLIEVMGKARFG